MRYPAETAPADVADRHGLPHLERFALYLVWHHKGDWAAIERHVDRFRENERATEKLRRTLRDREKWEGLLAEVWERFRELAASVR